MRCKKSVTKFSEAAGRDITTCREYEGTADGELGAFNWTPSGLHWGWGLGAGAAASVLGGQIGANLNTNLKGEPIVSDDERAQYSALLGIGVPVLVGGIMAAFRGTRTAGWAAMGAGVAGGIAQYTLTKQSKYYMMSGSRYDRDLLGLYAAQRQLMGAGVQVLNGSEMGLPVAEEVRGAGAPVQLLNGADPGVSVYQGGFGATFGTSLFHK